MMQNAVYFSRSIMIYGNLAHRKKGEITVEAGKIS